MGLINLNALKNKLEERSEKTWLHIQAFSMKSLGNLIKEWSDHNWPGRGPGEPLDSAVEELGELMRCHNKAKRGIRGTQEHWEAEAKKEFGDLIIALLDYAALRGWNPFDVVIARWNEVKHRDWQKFPLNGKTE